MENSTDQLVREIQGELRAQGMRRVAGTALSVVCNQIFGPSAGTMPRDLAEAGFENVAAAYVLPEGLEARDLRAYRGQRMDELVGMLAACNPGLQALSYDEDRKQHLICILNGVADGCTVKDMQHRLSGNTYACMMENDWYRAMTRRVEQNLGTLGWMPAPATLTAISNQMSHSTKVSAQRLKFVAEARDDVPLYI